jgi:MFS transporter, DHA2 family, multidrug resistance protein
VLGPGAMSFVANAGIFAVWLLAPFYLVAARGLAEPVAGVLFTCTPLGTVVAAPLAGRLADRIGPRAPVAVGLAVESAGLLVMAGADAGTPAAVIAGGLFAAGFGLGLFTVPNMAMVMAAFPMAQAGAAGGFSFLARTLGVVGGVLVLAETFALRRLVVGLGPAVAEAFVVAAGAVGLAAVVALVSAVRARGITRA